MQLLEGICVQDTSKDRVPWETVAFEALTLNNETTRAPLKTTLGGGPARRVSSCERTAPEGARQPEVGPLAVSRPSP